MKHLAVIFGAALLSHSALTAANSFNSLSASYGYNDNLNNAQDSLDIREDNIFKLSMSGGQYRQLNDALGISLSLHLGGEQYARYEDLNNGFAGVAASLKYKFGLGYDVPVLKVGGSARYTDSSNKLRDGWHFQGNIGLSQLFFDRLLASVSYAYNETAADRHYPHPFLLSFGVPGNVFDRRYETYSLNGSFSATEKLTLFADYTFMDGDVVASTTPVFSLLESGLYLAGAVDEVYATPQRPLIVAYTLDAKTQIYLGGGSWVLDPDTSLNLSFTRRDTRGGANFAYLTDIIELSLMHNF